jgi:hypothetical protein
MEVAMLCVVHPYERQLFKPSTITAWCNLNLYLHSQATYDTVSLVIIYYYYYCYYDSHIHSTGYGLKNWDMIPISD